MRSYFVKHKGKKELTVGRMGNRYTVDYSGIAKEFTNLMDVSLFHLLRKRGISVLIQIEY